MEVTDDHESDLVPEMDPEVERLLPDREKVENGLRREGYTNITLGSQKDSGGNALIYEFDGTDPQGTKVSDEVVVMTISDGVPTGTRVM